MKKEAEESKDQKGMFNKLFNFLDSETMRAKNLNKKDSF